jgi:WD40 repeat protein
VASVLYEAVPSKQTCLRMEAIVNADPELVSHPIRIHTTSSLWCSSSSPTGDVPRFAVGTSDGLYTLEGFGSYWALSKKGLPASGNPKHRRLDSSHALITAVEWLSSDVIAAGLKDSTIFLHDIRSGGSAARLQHPHAVTKIRNIDPYRIVVAGINSVCRILSLRRNRHV